MSTEKPILSFNKSTGCYEGMVRVQVDAEIFRRLLLKAIEEDETSDLTDPQTWMDAVARVGKVENWIGKPHTKVTPVTDSQSVIPPVAPVKQAEAPSAAKPKTHMQQVEERLRAQVRRVAPHLWDTQCLTPNPDPSLPKDKRQDIGRLRYDERQILKHLREEWQRGDLTLESAATEEERLYQEREQQQLASKLGIVASAVNGNRFH